VKLTLTFLPKLGNITGEFAVKVKAVVQLIKKSCFLSRSQSPYTRVLSGNLTAPDDLLMVK
jgi:hypothetical protein